MLLVCTMIISALPAHAIIENNDDDIQSTEFYGQQIYYRETDAQTAAMVLQGDGTALIAWCDHDDLATIYEAVVPVAMVNYRSSDAVPICDTWDNAFHYAETHNETVTSYQTPESTVQVYSGDDTMKENAIRIKMEQEYGSPYDSVVLATENRYSPIILRARESLSFPVTPLGIKSLPKGITVAAAGVSLASGFISVAKAVVIVSSIIGAYDATVTLTENLPLEKYHVTAFYERTGSVQPNAGARELYYSSAVATGNVVYGAVIDKNSITSTTTDYLDITYLGDEVEAFYLPDTETYMTRTLMNNAYEEYLAST